MIMIIFDDDDNGDDKIDNKGGSPGRAEKEPLHIDRTSPQIFCTDSNYFLPKYSAKIPIIFSFLFLIVDHYCLCWHFLKSIISTEDALGRPTTHDNNPIQSHPHIVLRTTSHN